MSKDFFNIEDILNNNNNDDRNRSNSSRNNRPSFNNVSRNSSNKSRQQYNQSPRNYPDFDLEKARSKSSNVNKSYNSKFNNFDLEEMKGNKFDFSNSRNSNANKNSSTDKNSNNNRNGNNSRNADIYIMDQEVSSEFISATEDDKKQFSDPKPRKGRKLYGDGLYSSQELEKAPELCKIDTAAANVLTIDDLMNVASNMKAVYQTNAVWIMNRKNYQKIAAMKDGNGHFYVTRLQEVDGRIAYKLFGLTIEINDAVKDTDIFLVNLAHAYKGMIKKEVGLKLIDSDKANALAGTVTLVLDTYVDAKIVQPEAIRKLNIRTV